LPNYTFQNNETGETYDLTLSMAEHDEYLANNPQVTQLIVSAPAIGDSVRLGLRKPDDSFRDVLRSIKKRNRGSNVNTF